MADRYSRFCGSKKAAAITFNVSQQAYGEWGRRRPIPRHARQTMLDRLAVVDKISLQDNEYRVKEDIPDADKIEEAEPTPGGGWFFMGEIISLEKWKKLLVRIQRLYDEIQDPDEFLQLLGTLDGTLKALEDKHKRRSARTKRRREEDA